MIICLSIKGCVCVCVCDLSSGTRGSSIGRGRYSSSSGGHK